MLGLGLNIIYATKKIGDGGGAPVYTPIWLWEDDWVTGDAVAKFRLRLMDGATETVTIDFDDGVGPRQLTSGTQTLTALWSGDGTKAVELVTDEPTGFMNFEYFRDYNSDDPERCDITAVLDRFPGFFISTKYASFYGEYLQMVNSSSSAFCNMVNYRLLNDSDVDVNTLTMTCTNFSQHTMTPDPSSQSVYTGDLAQYLPKIQGGGLTTIQLQSGNKWSFDSIVSNLPAPTTTFNLSATNMSTESVDNCLISCDNSGFSGCIINLAGNGGRTSASDAAVANLTTNGCTVYT
jgi:hypothetical protein